jgi:hypothetical protein
MKFFLSEMGITSIPFVIKTGKMMDCLQQKGKEGEYNDQPTRKVKKMKTECCHQ